MENALNNKTLLLLRGLPGSGKTMLAGILQRNSDAFTASIDDYFTDPVTGIYKFYYADNYKAYAACREKTDTLLSEGKPMVIVHHTFTEEWEMRPYFELAEKYGYLIFVCTVENYHEGKNVHEISEDQMQKMASKFKVKLL